MAKKVSLLEKARAASPSRRKIRVGDEEFELLEAFLEDEISRKQVAQAVGVSYPNVSSWIACRLLSAIQSGKYKLVRNLHNNG